MNIERIERVTESAMFKLAIPVVGGIMSVAIAALGWSVNKLSDHFERIDAYMAQSDTSVKMLRADVDALKTQATEIVVIRDMAMRNTWALEAMQRDRGSIRK